MRDLVEGGMPGSSYQVRRQSELRHTKPGKSKFY